MHKRITMFLAVLTLCLFSLFGCSSEDTVKTVNDTTTIEAAKESAGTKAAVKATEKELTKKSTETPTHEVTEAPQTDAPVTEAKQEAPKAEVSEAAPAGNSRGETMVWIPKSGSKYHSNPSCSNMKNPSQVSIDTAIARGYAPCSKCY